MGLFDFFKRNKQEKKQPEPQTKIQVEMANYQLPYFGEVNLNELEDDYRTTIKLAEKDLNIDINFENKTIQQEAIVTINNFLENIIKFDKQNLKVIESDFKESGETSDYIKFYIDELDEEELSNIVDIKNVNISKEKQLLSKLKLIRVGLYPDGKFGADYFGVFDYSIDIDGELCNQLLVVKTDEKGDLDHITWES
jgi:hypothetical protein